MGPDKVYAFDAASGAQLWSSAPTNGINAAPAVADGVVYIGTFDNRLFAFSRFGGQVVGRATPALGHGPSAMRAPRSGLIDPHAELGRREWLDRLAIERRHLDESLGLGRSPAGRS